MSDDAPEHADPREASTAQADAAERSTRSSAKRPVDAAQARSFSRGVGLLLQAVGAVSFLIAGCSCCVTAWVGGGAWQAEESAMTTVPMDPAQLEMGGSLSAAIVLVTTAVGAFALVGFGIGMQADRGRLPASGAALATALMAIMFAYAAYAGWRRDEGWFITLTAAGLMAVTLIVSVLTIPAMAEVYRNPPRRKGPLTIPAEAYTDPLSVSADKGEYTLREELRRKRAKLKRQLSELDELERGLDQGDAT